MVCKWLNICPLRELEAQEKLNIKWKKEYCESKDKWKKCKRYQLEEKGIYHQEILPNGEKIKVEGQRKLMVVK